MKVKEGVQTARYLPLELITDILLRLPVKSLLCCKCVTKSWYDLINDQYFIDLHLARSLESTSDTSLIAHFGKPKSSLYSINYYHNSYHAKKLGYPKDIEFPQDTFTVGLCNGLLCFRSGYYSRYSLSLYNPATRAYKKLPNAELIFTMKTQIRDISIAFGYDRVSNDYKVLKFVEVTKFRFKTEKNTLLYSLKNNAWKIIPNPPWDLKSSRTDSSILINNSLHWMTIECKEIKCFDLSTLEYNELPLPPRVSNYSPKLTILKGRLCVVTYYLDIWVLREYGNDKSWTRIFRHLSREMDTFNHQQMWDRNFHIACLEDGCNIILLMPRGGALNQSFILCDVETKNATKIAMPGEPNDNTEHLISIQPWVESLVPL